MSSDHQIEVMEDRGKIVRMLSDPAAVRRRVVGTRSVAIVARHRPHREPNDIGVALSVVDQRLRISECEYLGCDIVDADHRRNANLGGQAQAADLRFGRDCRLDGVEPHLAPLSTEGP